MARNVFFSFAYDDVKNFKVNVVRQSWLLKNKEDSFVDGSIWEKSKIKGHDAIIKLIDKGFNNTSVTAVLVGEDTANRRYVNYELVRSFEKGNGMLAIHINRIKGRTGLTARGQNPLDRLGFQISSDGSKIHFFELVNYKWREYSDLPSINNKKSNTLYFDNHWWRGNKFGEFFKFSNWFNTYCWDKSSGYQNFSQWIEEAATKAGR